MHEATRNVAELIPYKNFKEKIRIVREELKKNRVVEVIDELNAVYSTEKYYEGEAL